MIEQKKKLRLDELKVDSFVTTNATNEIKGGISDYGDYCDYTDDCDMSDDPHCFSGVLPCTQQPTNDINCNWSVNICTQQMLACYHGGGSRNPDAC